MLWISDLDKFYKFVYLGVMLRQFLSIYVIAFSVLFRISNYFKMNYVRILLSTKVTRNILFKKKCQKKQQQQKNYKRNIEYKEKPKF